MKTIASLPVEQLLPAAYNTAEAVEAFFRDTDLNAIRRMMPVIPEDASDEDRERLAKAQWKRNVRAMLRRCMKEKPEATAALLRTLVIPDEGEELTGFDLLEGMMEILSTPRVMETFFKSVRLALETFDD